MKRMVFLIVYVILPVFLFSQRWETVFPDSVFIRNGYINEDNTVEMVGDFGNEGVYLKVFDDGQYEMFYFTAPNGMRLNLQNLILLDNGGYFVTGRMLSNRMDNTGELVIMILDEELNVENEQTIQVSEGFLGFIGGAAVKDDDGTIVLLETARREHPNSPGSFQSIGVLFRFTQSGDCLNSRYLLANPPDPICYMNQIEPQKLMNDPFNQQIVAVSPGQGGVQSLLFFDHDFNLTEDHFIDDTCFSLLEPGWQCKYVNDPDIGLWYQENEMLFVATQKDSEPSVNHPHVLVGKMNREGEVFEKREINKQDTLMYAGQMVYANDSTIYVAVRCHTENYLSPFYPQVYLVNTQLEILGCISFWDHLSND